LFSEGALASVADFEVVFSLDVAGMYCQATNGV